MRRLKNLIVMETKFIVWTAVVVLLLVVFIWKAISDFRKGKKNSLFGIASDAELFYCPGDPTPSKDK